MKRIILIALLGLFGLAVQAQTGIAAICPECGAYFSPSEAHHFDDPSYHKPGCTWVKKNKSEDDSEGESPSQPSHSHSHSTHLKDYKPLPEVQSDLKVTPGTYYLLYCAGDGEHMITCPACGSAAHEKWCSYAILQKMAIEAKAKAIAATTPEGRRKAIIDFHVCEDNLLASYQFHYAKFMREREEAARKSQAAAPQSSAPSTSYQHLSSVDIKGKYDKKLDFGSDFATAYCATAPNGTERWALFNMDDKEVGQFSKVEFVEANGINQYILVRDDNGKWGIYGRGGSEMCKPKFESVKMLSAVVNDIGGKSVVFDVTLRNNSGVLQHGIYNPDIEESNRIFGENKNPIIIPCEYDYVELIDRSATYDGVLAKVRKNGMSGVIGTFNGTVEIPVAYSYINTYFTLKGGMYFLVGDGNRMGAYHVGDEVEEVVPVTDGYTLDKVKSLIAQLEE